MTKKFINDLRRLIASKDNVKVKQSKASQHPPAYEALPQSQGMTTKKPTASGGGFPGSGITTMFSKPHDFSNDHNVWMVFLGPESAPWAAHLYIKASDISQLMRDGIHVDNAIDEGSGVIQWRGSFNIPADFRWELRRRYKLEHKQSKWTGELLVYASQISTLAQFRTSSDLTAANCCGAKAWTANGMVYNFVRGYPEDNLNTFYDDMLLEGLWPWPKKQTSKEANEVIFQQLVASEDHGQVSQTKPSHHPPAYKALSQSPGATSKKPASSSNTFHGVEITSYFSQLWGPKDHNVRLTFMGPPTPPEDPNPVCWIALFKIKASNIAQLMLDGIHLDDAIDKTAGVVQWRGCFNIAVDAMWKLRRCYKLEHNKSWSGEIQVYASQVSALAQFRISSDMAIANCTAALAWGTDGMVYNFIQGRPGDNFNAIYDDMPLTGSWPWPKEKSKEAEEV